MKMLSAPPPRAASYLPNNFQLSRDFRRSKMQRIVSADKGRRCLRKARLKHRAKFPFHIHRLRLNRCRLPQYPQVEEGGMGCPAELLAPGSNP